MKEYDEDFYQDLEYMLDWFLDEKLIPWCCKSKREELSNKLKSTAERLKPSKTI